MPKTQVSAFGQDTFQDYFERLEYWFEKFHRNPLSWNEAEAFAIIANHFYSDWLQYFFPNQYVKMKQDAMKEIKREIELIREIAEGIKHIKLHKAHKQIKDQKYQKGGIVIYEDGSDIESPELHLILKDGTKYEVELLIQEFYGYWSLYLKNHGYIKRTKYFDEET
jgi:hypothetical protein